MKKTALFDQISSDLWRKAWVVHSQPVGYGQQALTYLARYVLRVAICNKHILKLQNDQVTFRYKAGPSGETQYCTLPVQTFIQRFLQHVLPKGFVKIRRYGFFSPGKRPLLRQLRLLLGSIYPQTSSDKSPANPTSPNTDRCCPSCGQALRLVETLAPNSRAPP